MARKQDLKIKFVALFDEASQIVHKIENWDLADGYLGDESASSHDLRELQRLLFLAARDLTSLGVALYTEIKLADMRASITKHLTKEKEE